MYALKSKKGKSNRKLLTNRCIVHVSDTDHSLILRNSNIHCYNESETTQ